MAATPEITGSRRAIRATKWIAISVVVVYLLLALSPWGRGVTLDSGNDFEFDPDTPWTLQFGSGHLIHGMDVYEVDHTGTARLRRRFDPEQVAKEESGWYEHTTQLTRPQLAKVVAALRAVDDAGLARAYQQARVRLPGVPGLFTEHRTAFALTQAHGEKLIWCFSSGPRELDRLREALYSAFPSWPPRPGGTSWKRLPAPDGSNYHVPLMRRVFPR